MDIFSGNRISPLAERVRPNSLEEFYGQVHLVGETKPLSVFLASKIVPSMIFWGPPGTGKTTLVQIIAKTLNKKVYSLNAIQSGVKELREVIEKAKYEQQPLLFIDEIHRYNKAQQDSLLSAVEKGIVILIGATTENPSFEVIPALLSRCQVYILSALTYSEIEKILKNAAQKDFILKEKQFIWESLDAIYQFSGGDARKALNILEMLSHTLNNPVVVNDENVMSVVQQKTAVYDKNGENHYDIISAFIKSIRGSDPNAAVYWLARMLVAGEDIKFIARRMMILASEDIGNANPNALLLANACFDAVHKIGMPEARIILSQTAIYLATSVKSNASYLAIDEAIECVNQKKDLPVPLHLRNAPTQLMKQFGYGKDYKYAHDYEMLDPEGNMNFLPEEIQGTIFYHPKKVGKELEIEKFLRLKWNGVYDYENKQ